MNDILPIFLAFPAGFALGLFYFGSLWITVRQLPTTQWPLRLFIGSYVGRLAIAALGFYLIIGGHWERALAGLLGFVLARILLVQRLAPNSLTLERSLKE
jgi:F1F0 ATPase subunit 2